MTDEMYCGCGEKNRDFDRFTCFNLPPKYEKWFWNALSMCALLVFEWLNGFYSYLAFKGSSIIGQSRDSSTGIGRGWTAGVKCLRGARFFSSP
jgi:hypothetical protein